MFQRIKKTIYFLPILILMILSGCSTLEQVPEVELGRDTKNLPPIILDKNSEIKQNGSIFNVKNYRPPLENQRARLVGDLVTIVIQDKISATQKQSSNVNRKGNIKNSVQSKIPYLEEYGPKMDIGANSSIGFDGQGATKSDNSFSGSITTTVVEVLTNGHLIVAGEKQIGVNHNVDVLKFTATIDPNFLQADNMISSTKVANLRVLSRSRGQQDKAQKMGWLAKFFMDILPF